MWRLLWIPPAMVALLLVGGATRPPLAHACSVGPDFDPVAASDVIVEGRLLSYEVLPDAPPPNSERYDFTQDPFMPVRVKMAVARVWKGEVGSDIIDIVDYRTFGIHPDTGVEIWGGGGSCGAFAGDPTGRYAILGLHAREDGTYGPSLPLDFLIGEGPDGEGYVSAVERMMSFPGAAALPALGSGPTGHAGMPSYLVLAVIWAAALGVSLLGASAALRRRTR